jgi:RNA polymerase sigma factor (sigma-70 family)
MSEPTRDEIRMVWRQLARRNDWALVNDEATFLDQVAAESLALTNARSPSERMRLAVWRAYSVLLYDGLRNRDDRAAQELWIAFLRTAMRDRWPQPEAEELAQETIARLIERLPRVQSPQGLLSYAFLLFRTLRRDMTQRKQSEQSLDPGQDEPARDVADTTDIVAVIEQQVVGEQLLALLHDKIPNDLERTTLLRIVIFGDNPRDVAHALGLPLHRTRVAKSRALKRLRQDTEAIQLLRNMTGNRDLQLQAQGDQDDVT